MMGTGKVVDGGVRETLAKPVAEYAPPDCAICKRSLLVGERLRVFRDRDARLVKVCELCRDRALGAGYETLAPFDTPRLHVQASGSVSDLESRDALIADLGSELAYLKQQLEAANSALSEHGVQADAIRAVTDKLQRQERELQRLRADNNPARRAEEQRTIKTQATQIAELRDALRGRERQVAMLQAARKAETDPAVMCGHALDAFNVSEHADRMARFARTLGEPEVTVEDQGPSLPRRVHVTLVWDIAWYEFCVKVDLGSGKASVSEVAHGGDPRKLPATQRLGNAQWRESGLLLGQPRRALPARP